MCLCVGMCKCVQCLGKPEEGIRSYKAGVRFLLISLLGCQELKLLCKSNKPTEWLSISPKPPYLTYKVMGLKSFLYCKFLHGLLATHCTDLYEKYLFHLFA